MKQEISLYIHIPFCVRKCLYCDFPSFSGMDSIFSDYVQRLSTEIDDVSSGFYGMGVKSIFFGGGTPSVLSPALLGKIMDRLMSRFDINSDAEITIEANPGTLDKKKLIEMKSMYFNRISMGLQAWQDRLLEKLGRIHRASQFEDNYFQARDAGFKNINVDIMFALPEQTMDDWQETLEKVIKLGPEHVSAYSLIIEEGTPFYDMFQRGIIQETDEKTDREMYYLAKEMFGDKGYHQYEISNFAKEGFESRHNITYWRTEEYRGFGLGAHSYIDGVRFHNPYDMKEYLDGVGMLDKEKLTIDEKEEEFMFMGLRMNEGISKTEFRKRFNVDIYDIYGNQLKELSEEKLIKENGDRISLTDRGIDVSNSVFEKFIM